jgi:hypothetical protein
MGDGGLCVEVERRDYCIQLVSAGGKEVMLQSEFKPDVTADIEDWDYLTDAIVWLIEQDEDFHLSCAKLNFGTLPRPHVYGGYEHLREQVGRLTGYTKDHKKPMFIFSAEWTDITVEEPDTASGVVEAVGVKIEVEKLQDAFPYDSIPFATLVIEGENRKSFKIQSKKLFVDDSTGKDKQ